MFELVHRKADIADKRPAKALVINILGKWQCIKYLVLSIWVSSVVLVVKNSPVNPGDIRGMRSIPGWGRSPREGNGNPLQYSCLENHMDRGAWWATAHGVTKSNMTEWLRNKHPPFSSINWGTQCSISIIHMDTFDHTTNICVFLCQSNSGWYIKMHEMDLAPGNLIWMNLPKGKNYL